MHTLETVYQLAFLVDDLDASAEHWLRRGAGPFFRIDDFAFTEPVFPEQAALPCLSIMLGYSGGVMLELIRVEDDPTGLYTAPVLPGPHHVAVLVEDIDRYLDGRGMRESLALQAHFPTGTPVAMLDTRPSTGLLTELVTADDAVRGMIAAMREATAGFDGSDPIRSFG